MTHARASVAGYLAALLSTGGMTARNAGIHRQLNLFIHKPGGFETRPYISSEVSRGGKDAPGSAAYPAVSPSMSSPPGSAGCRAPSSRSRISSPAPSPPAILSWLSSVRRVSSSSIFSLTNQSISDLAW